MVNGDGFSFKEAIIELKVMVSGLAEKVDHVETKLDTETVKRTEFEMFKEIQRNTRRWAIGTILTIASLVLTATTILLTTR